MQRMDNLSPSQRKSSMRGNVSSGTAPEVKMRMLLRQCGIRFRSQSKGLPGRPDFVLPENGIVLFVHGCYWHCHGCRPNRLPATNTEYWRKKFAKNIDRDNDIRRILRKAGWHHIVVWECQIKAITARWLLRKITKN